MSDASVQFGLSLGKRPNDPAKPRVRLNLLGTPAWDVPLSVDWYSAVGEDAWGMDGNDSVGDCTFAEVDHTTKAIEKAALNPVVNSTTAEVLGDYSALTGYRADDPSTDQGAVMQDVRAYWRKTGVMLGGSRHHILLFAEVDRRDLDAVKWALAHFGPVGLGIDCPESALDQFNAGADWTVVHSSRSAGGHAICLVGYDKDWLYVVTWGRVQRMSYEFFRTYVDEAWTQLDQEWVNTDTGRDALGEVVYDLGQQFNRLTGQANPFPPPGTNPPAPPAPDPGAAGFPVVLDPPIAAHVQKLAARKGISPDAWVNDRLRRYFD